MAAPSGTKWGSIAGSKGRIGFYISISNTATQTTVKREIWFWSKWGVSDSSNTLYYNDNATSATTSKGSVSISTSVSSGSGWSKSNQKKLKTYTTTFDRGTSAVTRNCAAKLTGINVISGTMTVKTSYTIPALAKYTVTYNSNGGSGAPAATSGYHGKATTLSSGKPTRSGFTFLGWSTSSTATSATYSASASITLTANITLYAVWQANTYTVTYNANGGSGAPASHSYTYATSGTTKLSNTIPTRSGYRFLGWALSSTATSASYSAGQNWNLSNGSNYTLYAVWTKSEFMQTIMARYQQPDGSFPAYTQVYVEGLEKGDVVSWSQEETDEYKYASVSYVVGDTSITTYVDIIRKQYQIHFNANGGLCAPKTMTFYYNSDLYLPNKRPAKSGYTFLGWSTSPTATVREYASNEKFNSTNTSSPTLYAIWKKRNYDIYLYENGIAKSCEFIETDHSKFNKNGSVYTYELVEGDLEQGFKIGNQFYAGEFSERFFEEIYLVDEFENQLTDENGNSLIIEVEV